MTPSAGLGTLFSDSGLSAPACAGSGAGGYGGRHDTWAGATLTALRDANGELQGYAKLTRDLTAAHAAEAALKAAKEATETGRKVVAENRAKGAFLAAPQADAKGLTLTDAIGGSAAELCYWGDEGRVRQILMNLLANAVKFTPGGGRVTVSAAATQQAPPDAQLGALGPWVYIRVEDNGEGIPADQLGTIFEPCEQVGNVSAEGAGLGLAISQRLARLMGGDLTATSVAGVGSSFFLWLENSATRPATPPE